jgi:hypothetical protein
LALLKGRFSPALNMRPESRVALGLAKGYSAFTINGHNVAVSTTEETLWSEGGIYGTIAVGETIDIVSSVANDDKDSGTGIQQIQIIGLDDSHNTVVEVIDLEGQTPVTTSNTFRRVNKVVATKVGTTGGAVGNITTGFSTSTTVHPFHIPIGETSSQQAFYTIPNGKTGIFTFIQLGNGTNDASTVRLRVNQNPDVATSPWITVATLLQSQGLEFSDLPGAAPLTAGQDVRVDAAAGSGSDDVFVSLVVLLRDND